MLPRNKGREALSGTEAAIWKVPLFDFYTSAFSTMDLNDLQQPHHQEKGEITKKKKKILSQRKRKKNTNIPQNSL